MCITKPTDISQRMTLVPAVKDPSIRSGTSLSGLPYTYVRSFVATLVLNIGRKRCIDAIEDTAVSLSPSSSKKQKCSGERFESPHPLTVADTFQSKST